MQGGTFYNDAVLRALEKLLGCTVVRPDVAGLMGAYGIALITRDRYPAGHATTLIAPDGLASLSFQRGETLPRLWQPLHGHDHPLP